MEVERSDGIDSLVFLRVTSDLEVEDRLRYLVLVVSRSAPESSDFTLELRFLYQLG
jgi:hypothetical protein